MNKKKKKTDVGEVIKIIAIVFCVLEVVAGLSMALDTHNGISSTLVFGGMIISVTFDILMYGFGELISIANRIENKLEDKREVQSDELPEI